MGVRDIRYSTGQIIAGTAYCSAEKYNGLFEYDVNTGESKFIDFFPNEEKSADSLYRRSIVYDDKVYFIPDKANEIAVYDKNNGKISKICHPDNSSYLRANCALFGECIWLIPIDSNKGISILNLADNTITTIDSLSKLSSTNESSWVLSCEACGNKFWGVFYNTDKYFSLDINSCQVTVYQIPDKKLLGLNSISQHIWITNYLGDEVYSILGNGEYSLFKQRTIKDHKNELSRSCGMVLETKKYLYGFPSRGYTDIFRISKETKEEETITLPDDIYWDSDNRYYQYMVNNQEHYYVLPYGAGYGVRICNEEISFVHSKPLSCDKSASPLNEYAKFEKGVILSETPGMDLKNFLGLINEDY